MEILPEKTSTGGEVNTALRIEMKIKNKKIKQDRKDESVYAEGQICQNKKGTRT